MLTRIERVTDDTTADELEALCRRAMAEVARIKPRGFDGQRDRRRALARCDALLDEFNDKRR